MAIYGDAFFGPAQLDAAVADLGRVDLRRGRYAAAQLWKLNTVGGYHVPLGEMIAPYLGDVVAVVPHSLAQVYQHIDSFRLPTREQNGFIDVPVWAEEVRGMPVHYFQVGTLRERNGVLPRNATRYGFANVRVHVALEPLFNAAWMRRFHAEWPMVLTGRGVSTHPALDRLVALTVTTNFAIRNHVLDRRTHEIARRRRQAARHGLRVDENGRLIPPGGAVFGIDSDSE